jgi:hypothetical protein
MYKDFTGAKKDTFEHVAKNWEAWENGKISAKEKRILMTHIYGEAYDKLCSASYAPLIRAAFEKTGILQTRSGKNDGLVTAEALKEQHTIQPQ